MIGVGCLQLKAFEHNNTMNSTVAKLVSRFSLVPWQNGWESSQKKRQQQPPNQPQPRRNRPQQKRKRRRKKNSRHQKSWPKVKSGEWGYVYICGGPFEGRFGYYDDKEGGSLVYFGAPLVGDGPYKIPLRYLRDPPASHKRSADSAPF